MKLRVDNREPPHLKEWLKQNVAECTFENLPAGDFEFVSAEGVSLMLIERKEIEDLCASLKDGRFDDQKQKLSASAAASVTPHPIVLLIEGNYDGHEKTSAIESLMLTTRFRDGFFVLRSTSAIHTGERLVQLWNQFQRGKFNAISEDELHKRFIASRSVHRAATLSRQDNWWQLALAQIDGVGPKAAKAIAEKYPTAQSLIYAYQKCSSNNYRQILLADIVPAGGARRVGPKISQRVWDTISGDGNLAASTKSKARYGITKSTKSTNSTKPAKEYVVKEPPKECLFVLAEDD